ncbi:uncharacterized protein [Triticum aestivum]|uniref:uncharacterized protein n=1 Tax=Triticum aestivum TaxID=4565 RepID=UPI001D030748|nr:uncharacterized protein LOC123044480 [Triticum aestivum]XP_044323154.1 uncharacterized protein LOC123044480 [Triticum aestivum]
MAPVMANFTSDQISGGPGTEGFVLFVGHPCLGTSRAMEEATAVKAPVMANFTNPSPHLLPLLPPPPAGAAGQSPRGAGGGGISYLAWNRGRGGLLLRAQRRSSAAGASGGARWWSVRSGAACWPVAARHGGARGPVAAQCSSRRCLFWSDPRRLI